MVRRLSILLAILTPGLAWAADCTEPARQLRDPMQDVRDRAATALYDHCSPASLGPDDAAALRASLDLGVSAAGAVLLLGHFPDAASKAALEALRRQPKPIVKLHPWGPIASQSLAASVALARTGSTDARSEVHRSITEGNTGNLRFLLEVLKEIDDPSLLRALAEGLSDRREIPGGVPSHAEPQRRVCDLTAEAFASKLGLSYSFPLSPGRRYTDHELAGARSAVAERLSPP
jgi:hypothetical protein